MSKWDSDDNVRKAATYKFCQMLDQDANLRKTCQEDRDVAWDTLRKAGGFEDMPHAVEVRVFEVAIDSNDKVVTMVIPKQGGVKPHTAFDPNEVWRCSWSDAQNMSKWKTGDGPAARGEATYKFCQMLDQDPGLRQACQEDRNVAWQALRKSGDFEDMPHAVEVRVFEDAINSNDKMVTMVIPKQDDV
jgi:hypothetical protein